MLASAGFGLAVVSLVVLATSGVGTDEAGVAASLLNVGQEAGGAFGIAALGTTAWTVAVHRFPAGAASPSDVPVAALHGALAAGFDRAFLLTAGLALLILVVAVVLVRASPARGVPAEEPKRHRRRHGQGRAW